jgi:anti-sigma factor RsiW
VTSDLELACRELVELVTDYLEGALPEAERARFEAHIAACPGCTAYLEQMRTTIRLTGMLTEEQLAPGARDELLRVFRDWKLES